MEQYQAFQKQLMDEFAELNVPGLPPITELHPMNGAFVNLAYPLPNGQSVKLLDDRDIYLVAQVPCAFNDGEFYQCYGLAAGMDFLLVSEYGMNCSDPELVIYKKR